MNKDKQTRQALKQALDRQALSDATRAALHAARLRALDGASAPARPRWVPAAGFALVLLAVAGLWLGSGDNGDPLPALSADELAVIASEDELEMLEEYEFYLWFDDDKNV